MRTARKKRMRSTRRIAEWERPLARFGFERIHRSFLVNMNRVREMRLRPADPNDWELKLAPPVNTILPISRRAAASLRKRHVVGEGHKTDDPRCAKPSP